MIGHTPEGQRTTDGPERPTGVPEGPAQAAKRWLAEHGDVLWRFVLARTRSTDSAEDVLQETFAAAMRAHGDFAGRSSERTWLLGIAAHKASDLQRRRAREARRLGAPGPRATPEFAGEFTPDGRWTRIPSRPTRLSPSERDDLREALRRCLDELPPGQAELFWLREVMEVPLDEVRKMAGITATNLWTRLHRARVALRLCLEPAERALGKPERASKESDR